MTRVARYVVRVCVSVIAVASGAGTAAAQGTAPAPVRQPAADDAPSIRLGATLFTDFTYTSSPESTDVDGRAYHPSQFNVGRSYLNVTGAVSRLVAFRITPDIVRETGTGSSLNGSLTFRLKYAFAQVNLDDWMGRGSWVRLGIQQTPWLDFEESIYRYRFQGTVFSEREGYLTSSDAGASFHYSLPSDYGEVHAGIYNGENYNHAEVNGRKAVQIRASLRPFAARSSTLKGLRVHGFYDADSYVKDGNRRRADLSATFEHPRVNAGVEYLATTDQTLAAGPAMRGRGYSLWATPRLGAGWEALLRYDRMAPDRSAAGQTRARTIVGAAYWFPHQGNVSTAVLVDYDGQVFHRFSTALPDQKRMAVHALVNF